MRAKLETPWFSFNGVRNTEVGALMVKMPTRQVPAINGSKITISGRDGYLFVSDGTYGAITVKQDIFIPQNKDVRKVLKWLTRSGQLVFSDEPEYYYEAVNITTASMSYSVQRIEGQKVSITFTCQPFKKQLREQPVVGQAYNHNTQEFDGHGDIAARPIVALTGSTTEAILNVNGNEMKVTLNGVPLYIDCEAKLAYTYNPAGDIVYAGNQIMIEDGDWFTLNPEGENNTFKAQLGIDGVTFYPNWRFF